MAADASNVIAFGSGRPLEEEISVQEVEHAKLRDDNTVRVQNILLVLSRLAAEGRIDSLVVAAHDPVTGLFHTQLHFPTTLLTGSEAHAFVGALESLKFEMIDASQMAPYVGEDGRVHSPYQEIADYEEDE